VNESRVMTFYSRADAASLLKNVNLGKKSEAALDALMEAKSRPDEDVFEDFLAASDFSAETKIRLLQVKDAIMQMADISIWADRNDINAGRGSRSAVSATSKITLDDGTSFIAPPAVGSGIRAATVGYGSAEAGNIHLFAPEGVIDAGEAKFPAVRLRWRRKRCSMFRISSARPERSACPGDRTARPVWERFPALELRLRASSRRLPRASLGQHLRLRHRSCSMR